MLFKKWFIPSRANNHHPVLLRPLGLAVVLVAVLASQVGYNYVTAKKFQVLGYATNMSAAEIISLSNQNRASNGLGGLSSNAQLTQAAQAKAQDMFAKGYWSHYNPSGQGPAYFISASGYSYSTAGENLAKDFNSSSAVVNAWMGSAGHKANILNGSFVHTGVAVVNGTFQGSQTTIVVAMYAAPQAAAPAPAPTPAPAAPAAPQSSTTTSAPSQTSSPDTAAPASAEPAPAPEQTTPAQPMVLIPASTGEPDILPATVPQVAGASQETRVREELNWAQQASLVFLATLFLINIFKHTVVWRTSKRGWRHIWFRAHPAVQYALLLFAIVTVLASSTGAIL